MNHPKEAWGWMHRRGVFTGGTGGSCKMRSAKVILKERRHARSTRVCCISALGVDNVGGKLPGIRSRTAAVSALSAASGCTVSSALRISSGGESMERGSEVPTPSAATAPNNTAQESASRMLVVCLPTAAQWRHIAPCSNAIPNLTAQDG